MGILLIGPAAHSFTYNVEKGEHPGLGPVDDILLEGGKRFPTGTATVHYRSHPYTKGKTVGWKGIKAVAVGMARLGTGKNMTVDIDKAGSHIESPVSYTHLT